MRCLGREGDRGRNSAHGAQRSERARENAHTPGRRLAMSEQTKHFLLIGFLGMFIGSIVFCFLSFKKKENKMQVRLIAPQVATRWVHIAQRRCHGHGRRYCRLQEDMVALLPRERHVWQDVRAGAHLPRAACRRAPSPTNISRGVTLWLGVGVTGDYHLSGGCYLSGLLLLHVEWIRGEQEARLGGQHALIRESKLHSACI